MTSKKSRAAHQMERLVKWVYENYPEFMAHLLPFDDLILKILKGQKMKIDELEKKIPIHLKHDYEKAFDPDNPPRAEKEK